MTSESSLLRLVLLLFFFGWTPATSLRCICNQHPHPLPECMEGNGKCFASIACYVQYSATLDGKLVILQSCFNGSLHVSLYNKFCNTRLDDLTSICCNKSDDCNRDIVPPLPPDYSPTTTDFSIATVVNSTMAAGSTGGVNQPSATMLQALLIVIPILCFLFITMAIVGTFLAMYFFVRRKQRVVALQQSDMKVTQLDQPPTLYMSYSLDTLDLLNQSCTSGSGSGEPILTQRTIARNITIGEQVGNGRFGLVYVGMYQGDEMAVKKFASRDEQSWVRETEIYNTVLLRHDNILGFFASDIFSNNGVTELWLITQYHPYGSLYDYLIKRTLTPTIMMRMAISTCRGLTHLHTEFKGSIAKPAIAHRDIKSRNILVKRNRECCIADFGLAVMKSANGEMNFPANPKQGTKRYMAPEILNETIDMKNFESFLSVDIYAFGLVLWEMCKRTGDKNESVSDYEAPFENLVGQDPTFEEMRKIVVHDRQKPAIPQHWRNSDLFRGMHQLMDECWFFNSSARNGAVFYKMKLYKLAEEDKIEFEHDDHE